MDILSTMPGVLAMTNCDSGVRVAKGEQIGQIELMKSFWPIEAPCAGVVEWLVALGEMVGEGQIIARVTEG